MKREAAGRRNGKRRRKKLVAPLPIWVRRTYLSSRGVGPEREQASLVSMQRYGTESQDVQPATGWFFFLGGGRGTHRNTSCSTVPNFNGGASRSSGDVMGRQSASSTVMYTSICCQKNGTAA